MKNFIQISMKAFALTAMLSVQGIVAAQTNISGIINDYTRVTALTNNCVDNCDPNCQESITVASSAAFTAGDRFLIIQMKGAEVDVTNTVDHGNITNLHDAGNYEFGIIDSIAGNVIFPSVPLQETYFSNVTISDSAYVQLIRVPVYTGNVNVSGPLTAQAWNGSTGGVLTFEATGDVTLSANISVDGIGFRGARRATYALTCGEDTAFYYQSTIWNYSACTSCDYNYDDPVVRIVTEASYGGCATGGKNPIPCHTNRMGPTDLRLAGYRGEGIAANTFSKTFSNNNVALFDKGRGRWGNGGGGGGNHNGGGGGGANYGAGGFGGNAYNNTSACPAGTLTFRKGYGGASLAPTGSKVFMGGGGGEGHDNGGNGSTGVAGGGIIFIKAESITNSGFFTITANGANNNVLAFGDGSGGGGAGGSILLNLNSGFTNSATISANGGKGGDHNNDNCHGTGGGGGGGVVWLAGPTEGATVNTLGGLNGTQVAPTNDCGDINWGATPGTEGAFLVSGSEPYFFNQNTCGFLLPVDLSSFELTNMETNILLQWSTTSEMNNRGFQVERSVNGNDFKVIGFVASKADNSELENHYGFTDKDLASISGDAYYRIRQIDLNGQYKIYGPLSTKIKSAISEITISPNPATENGQLNISFESTISSEATVRIISLNGQVISESIFNSKKGYNSLNLSTEGLIAGTYFIHFTNGEASVVEKILVRK